MELSNRLMNQTKRINEKTNSTIMKLKDFIYNNKTIQHVLGVLFVAIVTIVCATVLYYGFWIN
jgi:hypothetical protein